MPRRSAPTLLLLVLCGLCACVSLPSLTLTGRSSLRSRRNGTARTQLWTAGVTLGWSVAADDRGLPSDFDDAAARDARDANNGLQALDPGAPCAFDTTCTWEEQQRVTAMARAGFFESEAP